MSPRSRILVMAGLRAEGSGGGTPTVPTVEWGERKRQSGGLPKAGWDERRATGVGRLRHGSNFGYLKMVVVERRGRTALARDLDLAMRMDSLGMPPTLMRRKRPPCRTYSALANGLPTQSACSPGAEIGRGLRPSSSASPSEADSD